MRILLRGRSRLFRITNPIPCLAACLFAHALSGQNFNGQNLRGTAAEENRPGKTSPRITASAPARDLTIALGTVHPADTVEVFPLASRGHFTDHAAATIRLCERCKPLSMPKPRTIPTPLRLESAEGKVLLKGGEIERRSVSVLIDGGLRLHFPSALPNSPPLQPDIAAYGRWNITATREKLLIRLTLPSERYVWAVLMGETAPDEPLESLKAMAVLARTYALTNSGRHSQMGFDLCDSTHCQALRFPANESTRPLLARAVLETAGETLWWRDERAEVYYHQDCGGQTADVADVRPGDRAPYLKSHSDPYCLRRTHAEWRAELTLAEIASALERSNLKLPKKLTAISIAQRSASGRARTLELTGDGKKARIAAGSFRLAINRQLGWDRLRSDWYEIRALGEHLVFEGRGYGHGLGLCQTGAAEMAAEGKKYREILGFYFPGTTVRISPRDEGWQSVQSGGLTVFAASSPLKDLSSNQSSHQDAASSQNSNLDAPHRLMLIAQQQRARARSLFVDPASATAPEPAITLRLFSSTELFRQSTGQPGWVAATTASTTSTNGAETTISLQPAKSSSGQPLAPRATPELQLTLLHEILHALVEREANPKAPLWLREGLVEVLAAEPHTYQQARRPHDPDSAAAQQLSAAELETRLQYASSAAQAEAAHRQAAEWVELLLTRQGMGAVRTFLRTGQGPDRP